MNRKEMLQDIDLSISRISGISSVWSASKGHSGHEVSIMFVLMSGDIVTQKDICDLTGMPKQSANNIIKEWSKKGYIEMKAHPSDRRAKSIHLTDSGKQYVDELMNPLFAMRDQMIDEIGIDQLTELSKTLHQYYELLSKILIDDMKK